VPLIVVTLLLTLHSVAESRDPDAVRGFDIPGVVLSALGLGGPVFALIEQPTYGWTDPLVLVPLVAGIACFAAFMVREATARAPMLPLSLFRVRNFAVANAATLTVYAGLIGSSFFLTLYLQQVGGYTALAAGFAGVPISLMLFFLSPRFGAFTARVGPRLPMGAGPIVGGVGLLLLLRVGVDPSYPWEVLPALIVFGLGLSATVAPLTTTVLNAVDEHNAGIASGVNNAVARVAGLLAIAVLGAIISAHFATRLDDRLSGDRLDGQAAEVVGSAKSRPLAGGDEAKRLTGSERSTVGSAIEESSRDGFRLAMLIGALLMFAGGLTSAVWIQNPRRKPAIEPPPPRAATAGECARTARVLDPDPVPGELEPATGATASPL
jgi:Major Facilitator Superfamily